MSCALQQLGKQSTYDIKSTEKSQVYLGIESETKSTIRAVSSTSKLVLMHKGRLINTISLLIVILPILIATYLLCKYCRYCKP